MAVYNVIGVGQPGKFFDDNSYKDALHYIFDPSKAAFVGGSGITTINSAANEMLDTAIAFGKNSGKRLRHSVLSFNEGEQVVPAMADKFAQEIILHYAPKYQIAYAVHNNTENPHIHFVMNQISFMDGRRYDGKRKDYHAFQRYMRQVTHLPVLLSKDRVTED